MRKTQEELRREGKGKEREGRGGKGQEEMGGNEMRRIKAVSITHQRKFHGRGSCGPEL